MPAPPRLRVEAVAGPALELLIGLYSATSPDAKHEPSWVPRRREWSGELADAIAAAGDRSGEAWLHLLGLALELPHADASSFVRAVARIPARELRRHLVGFFVPAWVGMVGTDLLERGSAGEAAAVEELVMHPRYYAGRAAEALGPLLRLPARETRARLVAALERFAGEAFVPHEEEVVAQLQAGVGAVDELLRTLRPEDVIATATNGYLYEPESELDRVLLVPHLAARPALLLCQHRTDRIICYPLAEEHVDPEAALAERAVALGRALGDDRRVQMLRHLAVRDASLDELAETIGLARSTAHHHLAHLRRAGLIALRGNARGYWYALRPEGLYEAQRALGELGRPPEAVPAPRKRRRQAKR